jgi:hypothetical protein
MFETFTIKNSDSDSKITQFSKFFFAVLVTALVIGRIIGTIVFPVYDDAYITYRYAENLAGGQGFVYHVNDWVLGATCPAFGVFAALLVRLGLPLPLSIQVINIACDAAILWLSYRVLTTYVPLRGNKWLPLATALLFGLFFAVSPILARICAGGMEMNLFLLGSLGSIFLYHRGNKIPAIAIAALCYFLRPEGIILVGVLSALELLHTRKIAALRLPVMAAAVMTPPLLLIYHFYGHVLPQSVTAKSQIVKKSVFVTGKGLVIPDPISMALLPFAVWGVVSFVRGGGLKKHGFLRTLLCWYLLYLAAYLVARPQIWSWYAEPIQYVQIIFAAIGMANLLGRLGVFRQEIGERVTPPRWWGAVTATLIVGFWALLMAKTGPSGATRYVYRPLEKWSQQTDLKGKTVLAEDIGAVGYFTGAFIYDTAALVWPDALKFENIEAMIRKHKPDYLFLNADRESIEMMLRVRKDLAYKPIKRFSITNDTGLKLQPNLYPEVWKQDYMLFERQ